jgi:glucose/arabinose dehydrogenase
MGKKTFQSVGKYPCHLQEYRIFAEGWLQGQRDWGRPADVEIGPDGALYVSDDAANAVYRISYRE